MIRHPEKIKRNNPTELKKPNWIKVKAPTSKEYKDTLDLVKKYNLHTVCQEAACPNIGECWTKKHATFMILGDTCTRACSFCNVKTGKPFSIDPLEPLNVAKSVSALNLNHVVITSVDRDDLIDGGAGQFISTIKYIKELSPQTSIEILTPDFLRKGDVYKSIVDAKPDVFNHNIETVSELYRNIRPGAIYNESLNLLKSVKNYNPNIFTKSGLMVGLGESLDDVQELLIDLKNHKVDFVTIGQYLQPSVKHYPLSRYYHPDEFKKLELIAKSKGFLLVSSSPLTRSSYHAEEQSAQFSKEQKATA